MWTLTLPAALLLAHGALLPSAAPAPATPVVSQSTQESTYRDVEGAAQLTEQGWQYIPTYTGEHRWSLSADQRAQTLAGLHILTAATALDPENQLAWWRRGHAATLLGNDDRARDPLCSDYFTGEAHSSLHRARELAPEDPWSAYALAMAEADLGALHPAIESLHLAIELCAPGIATEGPDGTSAWIAFKCREWLGELLMRAGRFDEARAAIESFYADFGENAWPLRIALGECALRQRNFAAAREQYAWIVEQPEFTGDPQAHAMLGYLEGLLGNTEQASAHLANAVSRERTPELYARLWQWLIDPAGNAELRPGLEKFLAFPPPQLGAWDLRLGRFLLGDGAPNSLIADAHAELERRWEANEDPGDLLCEAHFYAGLRHEFDAGGLEDATARAELLSAARVHYGEALATRPVVWKWEWAYARVRDAALNRTLGAQRRPQTLESFEHLAFDRLLLHPLGSEAPLTWEEARAQREFFEPGDVLISYTVKPDDPDASKTLDTRSGYAMILIR
ncbi:MAG: tetratricopeptide repeat protein [Planctomycetota bacterium]|jgi:hypothetical protein